MIAILLVASRSAAQPAGPPEVAAPGTCEVTIVHAPDDVRSEIGSWVAREPFCRVALEVRAIPTEGGFYLLARDSSGLLHERLVPDAQAAGVLVASWVADDALEPPPLPPPTAHVLRSLEPAAPPAPLLVRTLAPRPPSDPLPWALGVMVLPGDVSGPRVRATLDMLHQDGLAAELILAGAYSDYDQYGMSHRRLDSRALLGVSFTAREGRWRMRLRGALGGVWSHQFHTDLAYAGNWFAIPFEASLTVLYHLSNEWSIGLAPIFTAYQRMSLNDSDASLGASELGVLLELRHGS
ncbi:MAG TPA: hypothetical protein VLM79_23225 [Kofleriaceae bacterium]|nr:hypothetical protein [Kofleriaceae bacterium]